MLFEAIACVATIQEQNNVIFITFHWFCYIKYPDFVTIYIITFLYQKLEPAVAGSCSYSGQE